MSSSVPNKELDRDIQSALNALTILSKSITGLVDDTDNHELKLLLSKLHSGLTTISKFADNPYSIDPAERVSNESHHNGSLQTQPDRHQLMESTANLIELNQFLTSLGERISQLRRGAGLTQIQLSQLSGLDRAYLSSIENGRQNVTIGAIYKIAVALQINLQELLTLSWIRTDDSHQMSP